MADQSITGLEDAPDPLVGAWYLPIAQQGLRSRRILYTDLISASSSWAAITGTPTTLLGYGITDAVPAAAISAYGLTLVDDANAAAARTTLGLGNVDNTSDANKPVSSAQQTALNLKADTSSLGDLALLDTVGTPQIDNDAVTYAKIQNVSAATRLLGRGSAAGTGDVEELTVGAGLSLSGTALTATIAAANPTGTIGLAAVNGSAATFLRSDGAPALSQAIAPTWTALHSFDVTAGGLYMSGAPDIVASHLGLAQEFGLLSEITAADAALPEGAAHFHMETSVGAANPNTAYKTSLSATINVNSGSANGWAQTNVATVAAGGAKRGGIALELDLNNFWGDYTGAPINPYLANMHITGLNTNGSTGGYATAAIGIEFAQNTNPMWNYGIHMGPAGFSPFNSAAISIGCNGNIAYQVAGGAWAIGVDLSSGTYSSYAFFSPGFLVTGAGDIDAASLVLVTPLAVAEGGTGAATAAAARANLGVTGSTYTPTLTNGTNVAASTAYTATWAQAGDRVWVWGRFDLDPTTTLTSTVLGISLPVASNFAALEDCAGGCWVNGDAGINSSGGIFASVASDRAEVHIFVQTASDAGYAFSFNYRVI